MWALGTVKGCLYSSLLHLGVLGLFALGAGRGFFRQHLLVLVLPVQPEAVQPPAGRDLRVHQGGQRVEVSTGVDTTTYW